ncbi:DUF4406 domain-containing protein [Pseudomonas aeruginosa]|uniref:DUF4406 domain-containing protein n=1 Tax=Pseudomonas aeruginosa TaxID=287 RepID=UPI0012446EBE|nr:DUF4406 domain-containing protein [Pseudomonas aeruginosa]KAB0728239.1 DUF4406 domain-containing protein [Pseudomonas aeruginosa]MCW5526802.1 DUF4406 domain-containing protein [Pseudomonas aeruginosa]MCW5537645.1 DUF4406 domain-containing protein [Pseudomonas aeruginosa]
MMHRVYLSGPMTGIADFNYPAFNAEEKRIRALGYIVENPAVNMIYRGSPWETFMRDGIKRLMDCDILALLPGWERSRGANIERNLAITLGMHVVDAEALPEPDFVCKCRAIQFTCCSIPSDNDPFVCRRLAGMPAYKSPEDQLATARKALEQIAALTDVSTRGIGMDVLQIAKQALSN